MSLNCAEINLILNELELQENFIQEIVQPSYDSLALFVYGKQGARTVLISLAQNSCRLNETKKKIPKTNKPLRFMEFLRSRVRGCKIISTKQLDLNRIILFELKNSENKFKLYIKLWNNAANIIVTDYDNLILECFYRRPNKDEIAGKVFVLPPIRSSEKVFLPREISGEASFNQKIDDWYSEHQGQVSRETLLEQAEKKFNGQIMRLTNALEHLLQKQKDFSNAEKIKHQADLIMANLHEISKGDKKLICQDFETNAEIQIELDTNKTPIQNANLFYEKYHKAISGIDELNFDIDKTKNEIEKIKSEYEKLKNIQNPLIIEKYLREETKPKQQIKKKYPGITFKKDDWIILLGRTASENDELLRHCVKGQDLWLHVRDWSGSYVFIKARAKKTIPLEILLDAANLAVFNSKARRAEKADVYYTHVKYLRRAKNGPKGLVFPTMEKNLCIKLDETRIKNLEQCKQVY